MAGMPRLNSVDDLIRPQARGPAQTPAAGDAYTMEHGFPHRARAHGRETITRTSQAVSPFAIFFSARCLFDGPCRGIMREACDRYMVAQARPKARIPLFWTAPELSLPVAPDTPPPARPGFHDRSCPGRHASGARCAGLEPSCLTGRQDSGLHIPWPARNRHGPYPAGRLSHSVL